MGNGLPRSVPPELQKYLKPRSDSKLHTVLPSSRHTVIATDQLFQGSVGHTRDAHCSTRVGHTGAERQRSTRALSTADREKGRALQIAEDELHLGYVSARHSSVKVDDQILKANPRRANLLNLIIAFEDDNARR